MNNAPITSMCWDFEVLTDRVRPGTQTPRKGRAWRGLNIAIPLVLGLAWLGVVLTHLPLPYPSDQLNYLNTAQIFPRGFTSGDAPWQVTRYGLVIPARVSLWLFGYSEAGYHLTPILFTGITLAGTYALGTLLYSRWVGAAAALVLVSTAPMMEDAAALMPDMAAAGLFTVATALAVAVRQDRLPARWWVYVLIGVVLGWSYEVREFVIFGWPLIPIVLWRRIRWRGLAWVAAAMAAVGCVELLLGWFLYRDPLARVHGIMVQAPNPNAGYSGRSRLAYLIQLPLALADDPGGAWRVALLFLVPLGPVIAWRARFARYGTAVPLIWCLWFWVPMTLEGGLLKPDDPALRLELVRYWYPLFPGFVLGGLGALWLAAWYAAKRWDRTRAVLTAAVVVVVGAGATAAAVAGNWRAPTITAAANGRAQMSAFRTWMQANQARYQEATLWTDSRSDSVVAVYRQSPFGRTLWHTPLRSLSTTGPAPRRGDLVLLFDAGPEPLHACDVCRRAAREGLGGGTPPASWRPVFTTQGGLVSVYRVTR